MVAPTSGVGEDLNSSTMRSLVAHGRRNSELPLFIHTNSIRSLKIDASTACKSPEAERRERILCLRMLFSGREAKFAADFTD